MTDTSPAWLGEVLCQVREKLEEIWSRGDTAADAFLFEQGAVMRAARVAFHRNVGVSVTTLAVLGNLFVSGELSQTELQRRLALDGAAVTRRVKQLEAEGLITRRENPDDNRFTLVVITAEGAARLHEAARKVRDFATRSLDGIDQEDMECMRRGLARMRDNLERM